MGELNQRFLRAGRELGAGDGAGGGGGVGFGTGVVTGGRCGTGTVDQVINRVVICDGVPFGGGNLGDSDIFVSVYNGSRIAGFQGYFITAVRVVIAPIYDRDCLARGGIVEGVVCLVDDGAVVFYFGDLSVVPYDAVVSAGDRGGAGVDIIGVIAQDSIGNNLKSGKIPFRFRINSLREGMLDGNFCTTVIYKKS